MTIELSTITVTPEPMGEILEGLYLPNAAVADLLGADVSLTPDMILALAETRLRDMDNQIQTLMGAMNDQSAQASRVSGHLELLRDALAVMSPVYGTAGRMTGDANTIRVTFRGESMTVNELASLLVANGVDPGAVGSINERAGLQNLIDGTNEELRAVNAGNEMAMIRLQSAMQNRTTIISATTNLMKSIDEGSDAVVANLR